MYVDDIVITGSDSKGILSLKLFLHTKDLGMLKYLLGVHEKLVGNFVISTEICALFVI